MWSATRIVGLSARAAPCDGKGAFRLMKMGLIGLGRAGNRIARRRPLNFLRELPTSHPAIALYGTVVYKANGLGLRGPSFGTVADHGSHQRRSSKTKLPFKFVCPAVRH